MDSTQYNNSVTFTNATGLLILILHSSPFIDKSHFYVMADTGVGAQILKPKLLLCCTQHNPPQMGTIQYADMYKRMNRHNVSRAHEKA